MAEPLAVVGHISARLDAKNVESIEHPRPIRFLEPVPVPSVVVCADGLAAGAKVIAAASTDEKCAFCKQLGADETINYSNEDLRERLKELTGGKGPDVIYDPVGGPFTEPAFRSIAWRGRHLVVGFAAGDIPAIKINLALVKGASIVGVFWGDFARREPAANAAMMQELAGWYAQGRIKPLIDRTMPMSELKAAYARMGSREVKGKLVLVND